MERIRPPKSGFSVGQWAKSSRPEVAKTNDRQHKCKRIKVFCEGKSKRDNDGKFTFKNGGSSGNNSENNTPVLKGRIEKTEVKSPAEILYGDTHKKEKAENEYRSNLLNVLGDLATPAMIMYATNKELENEIKKNGLISTAKKVVNVALNSKPAQKVIRSTIGRNYGERTNKQAKKIFR